MRMSELFNPKYKHNRDKIAFAEFCNFFLETVRKESGGYHVGPTALAADYVQSSNPHCHSLTALAVREATIRDSRAVVVLTLPSPGRVQVIHSVVVSADLKTVLLDTYKGTFRNGEYFYGTSKLAVLAAWRFSDVLRAAFRTGSGSTLLPKLQNISGADTLTAS